MTPTCMRRLGQIAAVLLLLGGCSERPASDPPAAAVDGNTSIQADAATPTACPSDDVVGRGVDIPMVSLEAGTQVYGETRICAYEAVGALQGTTMTIVLGPASDWPDAFVELHESARVMVGRDATAIAVGEEGYAYGGVSKSAAAAISGGRIYSVEIVSASTIGDKQTAMIGLLRRLVP